MPQQLNDDDLIRNFEAGTLDPHTFDHKTHLRVGWLYVTSRPLAEAVRCFSGALKSWVKAIGVDGKYHETITWFFMLIISERQAVQQADSFENFIRQNTDLLAKNPSILSHYYKPETLASNHARKHYVLPDKLESRVA